MADLTQGLYLSLMGMAITFAALGLLVVVIVLLNALFRAPEERRPSAPADGEGSEEELAAALAVAVSLMEQGRRESYPGLGALLERPRGRWWRGGGAAGNPPPLGESPERNP